MRLSRKFTDETVFWSARGSSIFSSADLKDLYCEPPISSDFTVTEAAQCFHSEITPIEEIPPPPPPPPPPPICNGAYGMFGIGRGIVEAIEERGSSSSCTGGTGQDSAAQDGKRDAARAERPGKKRIKARSMLSFGSWFCGETSFASVDKDRSISRLLDDSPVEQREKPKAEKKRAILPRITKFARKCGEFRWKQVRAKLEKLGAFREEERGRTVEGAAVTVERHSFQASARDGDVDLDPLLDSVEFPQGIPPKPPPMISTLPARQPFNPVDFIGSPQRRTQPVHGTGADKRGGNPTERLEALTRISVDVHPFLVNNANGKSPRHFSTELETDRQVREITGRRRNDAVPCVNGIVHVNSSATVSESLAECVRWLESTEVSLSPPPLKDDLSCKEGLTYAEWGELLGRESQSSKFLPPKRGKPSWLENLSTTGSGFLESNKYDSVHKICNYSHFVMRPGSSGAAVDMEYDSYSDASKFTELCEGNNAWGLEDEAEEMLSAPDVPWSVKDCKKMTGAWRKDCEASDDPGPICEIMELSWLFQKALKCSKFMEIEVFEDCVRVSGRIFGAFERTESVPWEASGCILPRRDKRKGFARSWLETIPNGFKQSRQWEDPLGGSSTEAYELSSNGKQLNVTTEFIRNTGQSCRLRTVFSRVELV